MSQPSRLWTLHALVDALPERWTPDKREKWLVAIAGAADYAVETTPAPIPDALSHPEGDKA